ncbi:MAG: hypothetical protein AAF934_02935, partial [Bacteroidota bacterium]
PFLISCATGTLAIIHCGIVPHQNKSINQTLKDKDSILLEFLIQKKFKPLHYINCNNQTLIQLNFCL